MFLRQRQQGSRPQGNFRTDAVYADHAFRSKYLSHDALHHSGIASASSGAPLTDRLQELLVLEFHKNGNRQYMHLTVRGLYRHVLNAITDRTGTEPTTGPVGRNLPGVDEMTTSQETSPCAPPLLPVLARPERTGSVEEMPLRQSTGHALDRPLSMESARHVLGEATVPLPDIASPQPMKIPKTVAFSATESSAPAPAAASVSYRERLGAYLHPRDMRRLVTPFSTSNEPDLMVRRHVMLLNFDPLRAIILRDRLLVLVPDGADSMLVNLEQRVRGSDRELDHYMTGTGETQHGRASGTESTILNASAPSQHNKAPMNALPIQEEETKEEDQHVQASSTVKTVLHVQAPPDDCEQPVEEDTAATAPLSFGDKEFEEMKDREWTNLSFELQCTDAVLHEVGSILSQDTMELQNAAEKYMNRVLHGAHGPGLSDDPLTMIRTVKDAVQLMTNRVNGFIKSMNRILDDDEDMALMNLSRLVTHTERFVQPVPQRVLDEESDEPELILEAYLHNALTMLNYLDLVKGRITSATDLIDQRQDAVRNRILFGNMMISILTFGTTIGAMVGSFFGMNVPNGHEGDECPAVGECPQADTTVFNIIVGYTMFGCLVTCVLIFAILWFTGTIPHTRHALPKDAQM